MKIAIIGAGNLEAVAAPARDLGSEPVDTGPSHAGPV